ncbi:DUF2809 domain-containing protein [bacterium]|nr:DUF2809 domain-containing protein [bacterium]
MLSSDFRLRSGQKWTIGSLLITAAIGLFCKFYSGPAEDWVNNSINGVFYEIFWCVLISLFSDTIKPWIIAIIVLIMTCLLEFLQLWHHPVLEWIRSFFIGQAIIGSSFAWSDFPYYFIGCGTGWLWVKRLRTIK